MKEILQQEHFLEFFLSAGLFSRLLLMTKVGNKNNHEKHNVHDQTLAKVIAASFNGVEQLGTALSGAEQDVSLVHSTPSIDFA